MKDFTKPLKTYAKEQGADLIGIAPIERFKGISPEHHPSSIFPEAKSVIVVGRRITRGTLRGIEEGTQFDLYWMYGYNWLEDRFLAMVTFKTSEFLEDHRWEAVPLQNLPPQIPAMGIPVKKGHPAPNVLVDFDDTAVRAGLGEIGYCKIFLSPEFGPRQRFQIILTDAELEPDPVFNGEICDRSKKHREFCPLGAIGTGKEVDICEKKMLIADIDYKKCSNCKNGAVENRCHPSGNPDRLGAVCVRSCLEYLEKNNKLKSKFKNPFRKRTAWKVKGDMKILEEGSDIE